MEERHVLGQRKLLVSQPESLLWGWWLSSMLDAPEHVCGALSIERARSQEEGPILHLLSALSRWKMEFKSFLTETVPRWNKKKEAHVSSMLPICSALDIVVSQGSPEEFTWICFQSVA